MSKAISHFRIDTFFGDTFNKLPLEQMPVRYLDLATEDFLIIKRSDFPLRDYISANRRTYFKIFHVTGGEGILTIGLHKYHMKPGDIAFYEPNEIMSWQTVKKGAEGHSCLIEANFLKEPPYLLNYFKNYPLFQTSNVVRLDEKSSYEIDQLFDFIFKEYNGDNEDKKQAILLHLQMIIFKVQRIGNNVMNNEVSKSYRYIHDFLDLLESSFSTLNIEQPIEIKTAIGFADKLNVHPNYLNRVVKEYTGKNIRTIIQERLLYEAKSLLLHTSWDVREISHVLGFSEPASFSHLFKSKESKSPLAYRKEHQ